MVSLPATVWLSARPASLPTSLPSTRLLVTRSGLVRWRPEVESFFTGGAAVANDLVFGAELDGFVRAFNTTTGNEVWQFRAGAGVNAPPTVAGDLLLVPAGGPFFSGELPLPPAQNELIALRLGAAGAT